MTAQGPTWQAASGPGRPSSPAAYRQPPPTAAYRRPPTAGPPRRPRPPRPRWPFVLIGVVLGAVALVGGYLALVFYSSVGVAPLADPVPEECTMSAELLAEAGTPSWQSGPLHMRDGVEGVSCRWVAGPDEHVRKRQLSVEVDRYHAKPAAQEAVVELTAGRGGMSELSDVGDEAFVRAVDGNAELVARRGRTVVAVQLAGSDKTFFSGLLGESEDVAVPAERLKKLVVAVGRELLADAR